MPFSDVADCDILESRRVFDLDTMVPFHFFARNPFDGRVQEDHLITANLGLIGPAVVRGLQAR